MIKQWLKYTEVLGKRFYRPLKPLINPLIKRVKLQQLLFSLVVLMIGGSLVNGWKLKPTRRASFWPWSSKSHSEMALWWFEAGDENKAIKELDLANKLLIIKTTPAVDGLKKAEEKIDQPKIIREEIKSWEKVLREKPYFRDVLLRLAILNFQIYKDEKAREYFLKAEYLDPNNKETKQVKEIISSLL